MEGTAGAGWPRKPRPGDWGDTWETPGASFQREFILTFDAMACLSMLSSEHFLVCVYNQASEHVFTGAGGISCPDFAPRSKQGPAAKQQGRTKAIKGRTYWTGGW